MRQLRFLLMMFVLVSCVESAEISIDTTVTSMNRQTTTTSTSTTSTSLKTQPATTNTPTTLKPVATTKAPNKYAELTKEEIFQHIVVSIEKIWPRQFECGMCMNMRDKVREIGRRYPETEAESERNFYFIKVMGEERCFQGHQEYISGDWPTMTLNPASC